MAKGDLDYTKAVRSLYVPATVERIWAAITDPKSLAKWFASEAKVDLRYGGSYAFWGARAWRAMTKAQAKQTITDLYAHRRLGFSWNIDGIEKTWTWHLKPAEQGALVRVEVALPGNEKSYTYWLTLDSIELALQALSYYIETGKQATLPDYSDPDPATRLRLDMDASADAVFANLTQPELMDKWVSEGSKVELKIGGAYDFGWREIVDGKPQPAGPKKLLAVEPGKMLRHDWFYSKEPATEVEWRVEGNGDSCAVSLTHTGFQPENDPQSYKQGWMAFLYRLKATAEGKPMVQKE